MNNRYPKLTPKPPSGKAEPATMPAARAGRAAGEQNNKERKSHLTGRELTDGEITEMAARVRLERRINERPVTITRDAPTRIVKRPSPRRPQPPATSVMVEPKPKPKSPAGGAAAKFEANS